MALPVQLGVQVWNDINIGAQFPSRVDLARNPKCRCRKNECKREYRNYERRDGDDFFVVNVSHMADPRRERVELSEYDAARRGTFIIGGILIYLLLLGVAIYAGIRVGRAPILGQQHDKEGD
jgi:hypothetical protein